MKQPSTLKNLIYGSAVAVLLTAARHAHSADLISTWNDVAARYLSQNGGENYLSGMTMVHVAQFDAINAVQGGYVPYALEVVAPGASAEAAAAQAAFTILTIISRANVSTLSVALRSSLSSVQDGPAKEAGIELGRLAATRLIQIRAANNVDLPITPPTSTVVGKWRISPPNSPPGISANSRYMVPWTMRSQSEFRPGPPPALKSDLYTRDLNEVRLLGSKNSTNRTPNQRDAAAFHAAPDLAYLRPVLALKSLPLIETARAVALYYMARTDAGTAFLETQYAYSFWRPYTAIRSADLDGNDDTEPDTKWTPLYDTPNHPEYPSGTCTFTSASIEILKYFYGDDFAFTANYEGASKPRKFARLSDVPDDAVTARIAAGAHFRNSCLVGVELGRKIAQNALAKYLRPAPEFLGAAASKAQAFELYLQPGKSSSYIIESSQDLISWSPAVTNTYGAVIYKESDAAASRRFYPAILEP